MNLEEKIMTEMKEAMKAKNETLLRGLRAIKAEIIKAKTEPGANGQISGEAELKLLQKLVKQRKDSLEIYQKQNRPDLAIKANVDENTVKYLTDASDLEAGKQIFTTTCAACHLADGGGLVGPNLTDDYWLHGCSIKDIFKSITYGWPEKGMKSWKDDYSPLQIEQIASYVKSLHGTKPKTPKEPQGTLCTDQGAAPASGTDSTQKSAAAIQ